MEGERLAESEIAVKKTGDYLIACIICYTISFPLIPVYLLIDRWERRRAQQLYLRLDGGYQPGRWERLTTRCWRRV